ncbi:MAG: terpene cyclase/mutase family protein [Planctomycetota bacterium]|nr:terpene cyclase/mutase family protein [Planctomycetota bacterium]
MRTTLIILVLGGLLGADDIPARPPGVNTAAEKAIRDGLEYLAKSQAKDGSWRNQGSWGSYPTAMTALAGLAFVADGNTPTRGKYALQLRKAVDFTLMSARRNGLITDPQEESRSMYGHGFSMLFLAQVLGMEEDTERRNEIQKVLSSAVHLTARSQSTAGGWLYTPDMGGDEGSVTVTQIQALRACRNVGVKVPKATIDRAVKYIEKSANPDGGISYRAGMSGSRPPITAAAVATLYNAGAYDSPVAKKALAYCDKNISVSGAGASGHYYYTHLYLAQAYYQAGGKRWDDYYPAIRDWMIKAQQNGGAWMGDGVGTTYGTSIALIILQLPYKNLPICQR